MKVAQQNGKVLDLAAPYDRLSGQGALIGSIFGVACTDVLSGVVGQFLTEGVVSLTKVSTEVWAKGQKVAWDNANKRLTSDLSKGPCVGAATADHANPTANGTIKLSDAPVPRANSVMAEGMPAFASYNTAGPVTFTPADILGGVISRDPNGAGRTDVLPTAALLVAAVPGAQVGDLLQCYLVNGADAAEAITVNAGAGGTFDANQTASARTVPQNASKLITIRLTNVTLTTEAYACVM